MQRGGLHGKSVSDPVWYAYDVRHRPRRLEHNQKTATEWFDYSILVCLWGLEGVLGTTSDS